MAVNPPGIYLKPERDNMRMIVMLNPTNKRGTKTAYTNFRKTLLADGFILWGPELYMRVVTTRKSAETHLCRLENAHPETGTIRVMTLTERQFWSMKALTEAFDHQEQDVGAKSIVML